VIVLDASVLIAFLDAADAHHRAAYAVIASDAADDPVVHPLTLAEVLVAASRAGTGTRLAADLATAGIRTDLPDADQPLRLAELRASTRLRLPDCCVLDVASFHRAPLATFDKRLAGEARGRGVQVVNDV
jgi:predicted nucleic acid-binding protein